MYLIGDIGNTEIKVCLVSPKNKIIKRINFSNGRLSNSKIKKKFNLFKKYFPKINKILFCSVVPRSFIMIKKYLKIKKK